jgi:mannose-6-phosphate isomerase-like protein (cupin superfamily)
MLNRRDAVGGFLAMLGVAHAAPNGWPDAVFTLEHGKTTHESFGEVTVYHDGPTGHLKSMVSGSVVLKPGQEPHPPHQHPEEEFMVIGEGTGEILVDGKASAVGPGALMYCQGNKLHGIKNTGSTPLRFYYFKWLA